MMGDSAPGPSGRGARLLAIGVGGGIAGILDLAKLASCRMARSAHNRRRLLGPEARHGGVGTYVLGIALHFFIACSAAAIYYGASRRLRFLTEHPLVCGLFFGAAVEEVMTLLVFAALRAS